jgi:hypothetical protein
MGSAIRATQRAGDHRNVTVGRDGTGDFDTLIDAINYVNRFPNTITNFASIHVGPGLHIINNSSAPITLPTYISIVGHSEAETNVQGTDATKDLFIADNLYVEHISFSVCAYAIRHSGSGTCYIRECEADGTLGAGCGGLLDCSSTGLTFVQRSAGAFCAGTFINVSAGTAVAIEQVNCIFHAGTNCIAVSGGTDVQITNSTITNNSVTCFAFSGGTITTANNVCKLIGTGFALSGSSGSLNSRNDIIRTASTKDITMASGMAFTHNFSGLTNNSNNWTLNSNPRPYNFVDNYTTQIGNLNIRGKLAPLSTGSAAICGNATLVGGTVTVNTTAATTSVLVLLTRKTAGGTTGELTYTISAGTSFTINSSSGTDTSTISWMLVEPT